MRSIIRRAANFVVNKRLMVLGVMLFLTVICGVLIPRVTINTDMTKYLPADSSMKQGLDIMEAEFPNADAAKTICVMFRDLKDAQKSAIKSQLEQIPYIDSVAYAADSPDYNRDSYTLFVVNTGYDYGSTEEKSIEAAITDDFARNNVTLKSDNTQGELPAWVIIVAVTLLVIILFIMCGSWLEPFFIVLSIGFAIVINLGSNIFLGSISNTTFMIAAILQLVLSMNYSIILTSRYRQECQLTGNREEAMKAALTNAFSSITGGVMAMVVGLLMLLFMRFRIGTDLGIVLAKGVFISMVSIFTIMPALLLLFDKPLRKTKKKVLHIPMGAVSRFSYRYRRVLAGAFVVLLVGSYFLQGITETTFALKQNDPIADVFPQTNTMVMLYENADDEKVTKIAEQLKGDPHVKDALSYSTTLGKQYSAAELADVIKDIGIDMEIDPAMLDILYYDYYTQGKTYPITAGDFLRFIADDVVNNKAFAGQMGGDIKENMEGIKKFSNAADLTRPMNASQLANYFGMKSAEVEQLLLYYYMQRGGANTGTMTLPAFAHFIVNDVASDPNYASMMDAAALSQMKRLTDFTNVQKVTAKSSYKELAQLFGMEPEQMKMLFAYYFVFSGKAFDFSELPKMDSDMLKTLLTRDGSYENAGLWRLSAQTLVNFLVDHSRQLGPILPGDRLSQLKTAQKIINGSVAGTKYSSGELADIMGMNGQQTYQLYLLHTAKYGDTSGWKISVQNFVDFMVSDVLPNKNFSAQFNADTANQLKTAQTIIDAVVSGQAYTAEELSGIMGGLSDQLNSDNLELLYLYYASVTHSDPGWKLSIQVLFNYLNEEVVNDPRFEKIIVEKFRDDIAAMKTQLNDAVLQLKDAHYSRLILNTTFPDESEETSAFIADFKAKCDRQLTGNYYLIGSSPMNYEMAQTFGHEMLLISLLTALAIFIVVALTFRSFVIPAVLVLIVQCGVFITIAVSGLRGYDIYYLSSIIVQCILMGATIDYGILFTNYYREKRQTMELQEALAAAYNGSIHTILTSGSIMVFVLGVIGALPCDPSIGTICQTLSIGTLSAVLLVLFVLPGLLAAFDRYIVKNNRTER